MTAVKALLLLLVTLAIGSAFTVWSGKSFFYSVCYVLGLLVSLWMLRRSQIASWQIFLIAIFYFLIWLLTFPIVLLIFKNAFDGHCLYDYLANYWGIRILRLPVMDFFEDGDLIEILINIFPYVIAKFVLWIGGVNWITESLNILIVFSCHVFVTNLTIEEFEK